MTNVVFLHGLGDTPQVWDPVVAALGDCHVQTPDLFADLQEGHPWSLPALSDRIAADLVSPAHIVGLSLGSIVALDLAIRYPERIRSLFLSAPQVRLPKFALGLQNALMRALPASLVCPPGMSKRQVFQVVSAVSEIDLESDLCKIASLSRATLPVSVLCGTRDRANLAAARKVAGLIPGAKLELVPGVKHQWHTQRPELFAHYLRQHLSN